MKFPILDFIDLIATLCSITIMILAVHFFRKAFTAQTKRMNLVEKKLLDTLDEVAQLYLLMDSLAGGTCSPMHREIYAKLREMKPEEALKKSMNKHELLKEISVEGYMKSRNTLKEICKKTNDPEKKAMYERALEKIDGIFNLLSTMDKNTPPEMADKIKEDILNTILKLREDGIDIEIGNGDF